MLTPVNVMSMKVLSIAIFLMLFILPLPAQQEAWPWVDDGFVRLHDPNEGKGRELFGYLQSVNEGGAALTLVGKEIVIQRFTGQAGPSSRRK